MNNLQDFIIQDKVLVKYKGQEKTVVIPDGVETIGEEAFKGKKALTTIIMPDSVEKIDISAFERCVNLEEIAFSKNLDGICSFAFKDCTAIEEIIIPESVGHIGDCAFWGCTSLKKLVLPSAFSDFSVHMIRECCALEELVLPDNLAVFHCQWSPREFSIFETTPKLEFKEYKNALYLGNKNNPYIALVSVLDKKVEEFTIHKDVKAIVNNAFEQCRFLKEISIPHGVKYIYEKTFFECRALSKVDIPDSVEGICRGAFEGCIRLEKIALPSILKRIDDDAFMNCFRLKEIVFPEELEHIGVGAFYNCYSLEEVKIPKRVKKLKAFENCYSLRKVVLPDGMMELGGFCGCESLKEINIDTTALKAVAMNHFNKCYELKHLQLPKTVEEVYLGFSKNDLLDEIFTTTEYKNGKYIASVNNPYHILCEVIDKNCEEFEFHKDTKVIAEEAFYNCQWLKNLSITNKIISIGNRAFAHCRGLKTISFPDSVKWLGYELVKDCPKLEEIVFSDECNLDFSCSLCAEGEKIPFKTTIFENAIYLGSINNPYHTLLKVIDKKCEELHVHKDTKVIGWWILGKDNSPVKNVYLTEGITFINKYAFEGSGRATFHAPTNSYAEKMIKKGRLVI